MAMAHAGGMEPSARMMRRIAGLWAQAPLNQRRLQRAIDNIAWCFPQWSASRVEHIAVEAYRHLFALATEITLAPRLLSGDSYALHVDVGDLKDGLEALCGDRPCILITGHCGNWELLGYALAILGFPMHALYRPLDLKPLDTWVYKTRSRHGLTLIDKFGAAREIPGLLEARRPVGFIADQNAGDRGLFVPFFDRLASSYKTIGLLAARYDAVVLCGHAKRQSPVIEPTMPGQPLGMKAMRSTFHEQGLRYQLQIVDIINPEDWADAPDPIFYITARYRRAIETMVRKSPEQYLWMHRYWKSRPRHERLGRPFPPALREKISALPWMTQPTLARIEESSARDAQAWHSTHLKAS